MSLRARACATRVMCLCVRQLVHYQRAVPDASRLIEICYGSWGRLRKNRDDSLFKDLFARPWFRAQVFHRMFCRMFHRIVPDIVPPNV